jgi:hypothetical protein
MRSKQVGFTLAWFPLTARQAQAENPEFQLTPDNLDDQLLAFTIKAEPWESDEGAGALSSMSR